LATRLEAPEKALTEERSAWQTANQELWVAQESTAALNRDLLDAHDSSSALNRELSSKVPLSMN
jgi:hypothetical protein